MMKILTKEQKSFLDALEAKKATTPKTCKFTEFTRTMFKDRPDILAKYFRNENNMECFYANLLQLKEVDLQECKKILNKDFGFKVSLAGYRYNPRHYVFSQGYLQEEYEEDAYREHSKEEEIAEIEDARRNNVIEHLDKDAYDELYKVLFAAIKNRRLMLFNLENVPGVLNNAIDCFEKEVSCRQVNRTMRKILKDTETLINTPEVQAWLKTGVTDISFDKEDYIETYQKALRQITNIRGESLDEIRDVIHNEYDLWEDEIIANDCIEAEPYVENVDYDEEDNFSRDFSFQEPESQEEFEDLF